MQAPQFYSSMKLPAVLDLVEQIDAKGRVEQIWSEAPLGEHLGGGFRLYAQLPSITNLTKEIRAVATHQYLTCIDLKNCYPTILTYMFSDIRELKNYVGHRDEVLTETMRHYGVSRDAAKQLYLRLSFKGACDAWRSEWAPDVADHLGFVVEYENAIHISRNRIIRDNSEIYQTIKIWIGPKTGAPKPNPDRTLMGYVLQKKERECIDAMRAVAEYTTVAILHDELMIEKVNDEAASAALLAVMNAAVAAVVPGMVCEIKEPGLPPWYIPGQLCWFERLSDFNPIDLKNHVDGLFDWLPPGKYQKKDDDDEDESPDKEIPKQTALPRKVWEFGVQMFSGADMRSHLMRKKKEDSRIDERLLSEYSSIAALVQLIGIKVQIWYHSCFFAVVNQGKGSIVEESEHGLFVMNQLQFKQKHASNIKVWTNGSHGTIGNRFDVQEYVDMRHVTAVDYYPADAPP